MAENFFEGVYQVVRLVPVGRVTTYGTIARYLGSGLSARMVGWAMNAAHTLPDVPAHRVVNREGVLTGKHFFGPGNEMQNRLEAEGVQVENDKVLDFKTRFWNPEILAP
jgi:methylated-DNA-protein-cysteine methyltransferase related protein